MIGETLRKSVTLVNRGALGTKVEFYKISGDVAFVLLALVLTYPVPLTVLFKLVSYSQGWFDC